MKSHFLRIRMWNHMLKINKWLTGKNHMLESSTHTKY
jgi:hypothetical protein